MKNQKIKGLLTSPTNKRLLENFFSLSILQVMNYIFPLITLPYLVRILGPEKYGLITFSQAFVSYFIIIINYGFDLSATREISINRENKEKLSEIFSSVMTVKVILLILCFLIMWTILQIDKFKKDFLIYYFTFGIPLGQVLFPLWLFLGTEKMKFITLITIIDRTFYTITIFIFIKTTTDYIYVPLLNSFGYIIGGIFSLIVSFFHFKIKYHCPTKKNILHQLKDGWNTFIATISTTLYTSSNAFILGIFVNNTIVGYYATAEKLIYAAQRLLYPLSQSVYPHISKLANESKTQTIIFIKKLLYLRGLGCFIFSLLLFIFAELIINIILGKEYHQSIIVFKIMAFLPFMTALSSILGFETMLAFKMDSALSRILLGAGVLNIISAVILSSLLKHIGASVAALTATIFIVITTFLYLENKGIRILKGEIAHEEVEHDY